MRSSFSLLSVGILASFSFAQLDPPAALKSMQPGPGLQVELFAHEPMLINPTAIDVDHLGRVWVAEAVNYRRKNFNRPIIRKEGDRIQILIDKDGDGKADEAKTFYQGEDLYGPLSVLVLPQADGKALRVLVAQSPDILEFWDRDGDLKADGPPTKFLSGFGGYDHDHGVHGLTVGPDGKLYFTVGDSGVKDLKSKNGKGKSWTTNTTDCQKGTVWRVDLDGNNLELIAHNFRNNYEACVDSFGEIWCSDNDDDGNQQTRICFVMPGGNYGYGPRGPGQSHWHEEQPGIVHKTLRTGFGSPTGICFYEGNLLPKQYQGDLIHCDAGPREVRYFKRIPKGAGYELEKTVMLTSTDNWFRPSDCCVAPDGSVFVSDWYDPGVGGHGMGDSTRGRIYRLTPSGHRGYTVPAVKLDTKVGKLESIASPNTSVRSTAINELGRDLPATGDLLRELAKATNPRLQGMSFLLARNVIGIPLALELGSIANLNDPKVCESVMRALRYPFLGGEDLTLTSKPPIVGFTLKSNPDYKLGFRSDSPRKTDSQFAGFRRDMVLVFSIATTESTTAQFYEFAQLYDGSDRTYLSALNIACGTDPARRDAILADFEKHFPEWNDKVADLVWELRPKSMLPKMGRLLDDPKLTEKQKARIVDIIAVNDDLSAGKTVLALLGKEYPKAVKERAVENLRLFLPTKWKDLKKEIELRETALKLLATDDFAVGLQLAAFDGDASLIDPVLACVKGKPERLAAVANALAQFNAPKAVEKLHNLLLSAGNGNVDPSPVIESLGQVVASRSNQPSGQKAMEILQSLIRTYSQAESTNVAKKAITALASSRAGTQWLLKQREEKKLPDEYTAHAATLLRNSPFQGERNKAMILFPVVAKLEKSKLPSYAELAKRTGDAKAGEALMKASAKNDMQCLKCHKVNGTGGEIGPDLSAIGIKGSRENLFESILEPSKAIADQHVSWSIETADGVTTTGLLVKETETALTIRDANGKDTVIDIKTIERRRKSLVSLMPEDLYKQFTEQELVDMVAYLGTLKATK
jgi:putative membrane-bound dehydrogenase-like protein